MTAASQERFGSRFQWLSCHQVGWWLAFFLAMLACTSAQVRADGPKSGRRLLFIGGPTLRMWAGVSPDLFMAKGKGDLLIAADGTVRTMAASLAATLHNVSPNAVMILPESGFGGENLVDTEADLKVVAETVRASGSHLVLAAPLHVSASMPPPEDAVLIDWMRSEAKRTGAVFGDFRIARFGPADTSVPPPLARKEDLQSRTVLVRGALDLSFQLEPGQSAAQLAATTMASHAAVPDTYGTGPYPAVHVIEPALASHTFYRPENLAPFVTKRLPVLIFGNGYCSADSGEERPLLTEIASHGYLVIVPGFMKSGPGAYPKRAAPGAVPSGQPLETSLADLTRALDWVSRPTPESMAWQRFIDPHRIAAAGWSCGGLQAIKLATDPRIRTTIMFDAGIFSPGTFSVPGLPLAKSDLAGLHGPVLYVMGGLTDLSFANGSDDFRRITHVPAVFMSREVGHGGTFWDPAGGAWAKAAVAWLDWHLKDDLGAKLNFVGSDCAFCRDPDWTVSAKGF